MEEGRVPHELCLSSRSILEALSSCKLITPTSHSCLTLRIALTSHSLHVERLLAFLRCYPLLMSRIRIIKQKARLSDQSRASCGLQVDQITLIREQTIIYNAILGLSVNRNKRQSHSCQSFFMPYFLKNESDRPEPIQHSGT